MSTEDQASQEKIGSLLPPVLRVYEVPTRFGLDPDCENPSDVLPVAILRNDSRAEAEQYGLADLRNLTTDDIQVSYKEVKHARAEVLAQSKDDITRCFGTFYMMWRDAVVNEIPCIVVLPHLYDVFSRQGQRVAFKSTTDLCSVDRHRGLFEYFFEESMRYRDSSPDGQPEVLRANSRPLQALRDSSLFLPIVDSDVIHQRGTNVLNAPVINMTQTVHTLVSRQSPQRATEEFKSIFVTIPIGTLFNMLAHANYTRVYQHWSGPMDFALNGYKDYLDGDRLVLVHPCVGLPLLRLAIFPLVRYTSPSL